jgi:hypothetical protein
MTRLAHLAVMPFGAPGAIVGGRLLIDPLVVPREKPEMLLELLFDV